MAISGYLETFSLPEVFKILERGQKTGRLTIRFTHPNTPSAQYHYIWLKHGRIVAASDRTDSLGLLSMLLQRRWLNEHLITELHQQQCLETPLCLYLKSRGMLQSEQIKLLFHVQVLQKICALFKVHKGHFKFDTQTTLPTIEMTGLSLSASEAVLLGLRVLKDWTSLADKLPAPTSALTRTNSKKMALKLDSTEGKVWELADGTIPLTTIAEQLSYPVELVQQAAFRLMTVGLLDEVVLDCVPSPIESITLMDALPELGSPSTVAEPVTPSFLHNLMTFLRSKVSEQIAAPERIRIEGGQAIAP